MKSEPVIRYCPLLLKVAWCADSLTSRRSDRPREYPSHRSQLGVMSPVWPLSIRPRPRERMWRLKKRNGRDCERAFWFVWWDEGKMRFWLLRWSGGLWYLRTIIEKKKASGGDSAIISFVLFWWWAKQCWLNQWRDGASEQRRKELFVTNVLYSRALPSLELQARLGSNFLPWKGWKSNVSSGLKVGLNVT